jgi:thymidylate synthase
MTQLIVAMTKNGGIGKGNRLPWHLKDELAIFKEKTIGKTLLMGRITATSIPKLENRSVAVISRNLNQDYSFYKHPPAMVTTKLSDVGDIFGWENVFIAGGSQIYKLALKEDDLVQKIHLSIIKKDYVCDTFFDMDLLHNFVVIEKTDYEEFTHYVLERTTSYGERQYLNLVSNILRNGMKKVGRNGATLSIFKNDMTYDLRSGFPLLTTKKMFLRGILEEFIFFLKGKTDSSELSDKKVRIWEGNTTEEFIRNRGLYYAQGVMGPMYGYQWRFFNADYNLDVNGRPLSPSGGVDQLANVVELIKTDPDSRRILMTAYNPEQAEQGVLYPCHSITIQFYVDEDFLDMFCYNRSNDAFHGIPFNIASSSLLLMVVAKLTEKIPRFFHMTMGDTHIYSEHLKHVEEQITRIPFRFPTLKIPDIQTLEDLENLQSSDFILSGYQCYSAIKAEMVV